MSSWWKIWCHQVRGGKDDYTQKCIKYRSSLHLIGICLHLFIFSCSVVGRIFEKMIMRKITQVLCHTAARVIFLRTNWRVAWSALLRCSIQTCQIVDWTAFGKENSKSDGCDTKDLCFLAAWNWDGVQTSPGRSWRGEKIFEPSAATTAHPRHAKRV